MTMSNISGGRVGMDNNNIGGGVLAGDESLITNGSRRPGTENAVNMTGILHHNKGLLDSRKTDRQNVQYYFSNND
jgi:hypothetical protein